MFWKDDQRGFDFCLPPVPDTGWKLPEVLPNLSDAKAIALDTETYDPHLPERGPGWPRKDGHVVGVSVAVEGARWYFPVRHATGPTIPHARVFAWLRDLLSDPTRYVIGANLMYDLGWLRAEGVPCSCRLFDVQFAEALLSESDPVSLDSLGQKYLATGKQTPALYDWIAGAYRNTRNPRADIYRAPVELVGPYAEQDADLPLRLAPVLWDKMAAEGLLEVFDLENRLIPLLLDITERGVRVDLERAEAVGDRLLGELDACRPEGVELYSAESIAKEFDLQGVKYPRTETGKPSFTSDWLEASANPLAQQLAKARKLDKLRKDFALMPLERHHHGRVHCMYHPMRTDSNGTRSGRLSASDPNLQQIPSRDPVYGPLIRGIFVPEPGEQWHQYDYSQIEYRFLAHFATGEGAHELREAYQRDPHVDYHTKVQDLIREKTGLEIPRKPVKNVNFGGLYGMGEGKLARQLGLTREKAAELFNAYHSGAPYVRSTMRHYTNVALATGEIQTILGRKSRFDLWEPVGERGKATTHEKALALWGSNIQRAFAYRGLNRLLQGSAADVMKKAMVDAYESGIFKAISTPLLTVHDELDFSAVPCKKDFDVLVECMQNAIRLRVPLIVEGKSGPSWGEVD